MSYSFLLTVHGEHATIPGMYRLCSLLVLLMFSISGLAYAEDGENIQDEHRRVGKILYIGSACGGGGYYLNGKSFLQGGGNVSCITHPWLWYLHGILVDNQVEHEFVGTVEAPDSKLDDTVAGFGFPRNAQGLYVYRGKEYSGKVISTFGLRASEISGNLKVKGEQGLRNKSPDGTVRIHQRFYDVKGIGRLGATNIADWLGVNKRYKGAYRLPQEKLPDVVIIMAGLDDLLIDSGYLDVWDMTENCIRGNDRNIKRATKLLLGNPDKAPVKRGKSDMDVIVNVIRKANPRARIIVLPIFTGNNGLHVMEGYKIGDSQVLVMSSIRGVRGHQKVIEKIIKVVYEYNLKLKQWAESRGVEFVDIRPGWCVGLQLPRSDKKKYEHAWADEMLGYNLSHGGTNMFRLMAHHVATSLGSAGGTDGLARRSSRDFSRDVDKRNQADRLLDTTREHYSLKLVEKQQTLSALTVTARFSAGSREQYAQYEKTGFPNADVAGRTELYFMGLSITPEAIRYNELKLYEGCMAICDEELRFVWEKTANTQCGVARYWLGDKLLLRMEMTEEALKKRHEISRRLDYPGKFIDLAYTMGAYAPPLPERAAKAQTSAETE